METLIAPLESMNARIEHLMAQSDIEGKTRRADELEAQTGATDFWATPDAAQTTMREIARLRGEVERWNALYERIQDALELAALADDGLVEELQREVGALNQLVERVSLQAMFSGEYDAADAILAIHAGAGGTDSQDWAAMLERMFLRWAADNSFKVEELERSLGEEAGIKSALYSVRGDYAYGNLQSEQGVHRLVRLSPFDAANRRHTSFAKVELWPDIQGEANIEVNEKDLKIETYRSSGAGGQNVQKNETAIRITHLPSGTVVAVQNQRSQQQNKERALQILKARLFELERKKRDAELAVLKGDVIDAAWGNQIRSYVLHPYHMVKDHRTGHEVGNTGAVLDGRLNDFMEAYLRAKLENGALVASPEEM